jgi:hypothetical protein
MPRGSLHIGFGALTSLVKLQASFNPFTSLPGDMFDLPKLEMFRLAVGGLPAWPCGLAEAGGCSRPRIHLDTPAWNAVCGAGWPTLRLKHCMPRCMLPRCLL